ncbi:zinc knuckle CX2CX4HX4C [Artemisia annua]|uniref:Zinc knuckle CX2CX4HX4C n=1 Tax=Artemisia annua TaxID=35608 RepID=A0A2U1MT80_ARTAN|nr:zinc knuckle CX2CX4HX4C [Artemisia annua]
MAIPNEDDSGYTTEIIKVEYEWTPPHCDVCKVFGHDHINCPKSVKEAIRSDINVASKASTNLVETDEGFTEVQNRKDKGKKVGVQTPQKKPFRGIDVGKGVKFSPSKPEQVHQRFNFFPGKPCATRDFCCYITIYTNTNLYYLALDRFLDLLYLRLILIRRNLSPVVFSPDKRITIGSSSVFSLGHLSLLRYFNTQIHQILTGILLNWMLAPVLNTDPPNPPILNTDPPDPSPKKTNNPPRTRLAASHASPPPHPTKAYVPNQPPEAPPHMRFPADSPQGAASHRFFKP